jgi:magnesium transporter
MNDQILTTEDGQESDILGLLNNPETKNCEIKAALEKFNIVDIAGLFNDLDNANLVRIFHLLSKDTGAEVFAYLDNEKQQHLLEILTDTEISYIVNDMFADDAADITREMPSNIVTKILALASPQARKEINMLLQYPESSAGSIMTTEFVWLKKEMTVAEAFARIRKTGLHKETVYTCYVTDPSRKLEGVVSVRQLLLADTESSIGSIMDTRVIYAKTQSDVEEVAELIQKYDFMNLPVVDSECRIVGIVTSDDIVGVIRRANTEDIERMAALSPSTQPYLKTGVFKLTSQRIVWLGILVIVSMFTGMLIKGFEAKLTVLLVCSLPMLMDSSGNAGSQASTMIIRGLALNQVAPRNSGKILLKEILVGLMCGATMIPLAIFKVMVFDGGGIMDGLTVGITMMLVMTFAKIVGSQLPLVLKLLKLDPAVMATPLLATIADTVTISVYFLFAALFGVTAG